MKKLLHISKYIQLGISYNDLAITFLIIKKCPPSSVIYNPL